MTGPRRLVGIAELAAARAPGTLTALALGSCVAVLLYDRAAQVGGLAHVLLPTTAIGRARDDRPARFAPVAVERLTEAVLALGAERPRLTARLVGGASMFTSLQPVGSIQMGERNVHAVREALHRLGIRKTGELVGGDYGRSVDLDLATGRVTVTSYQHDPVEL